MQTKGTITTQVQLWYLVCIIHSVIVEGDFANEQVSVKLTASFCQHI